MPFGDGTTPYFSGNPQTGYPVPPTSWNNVKYPDLNSLLSGPSTTHCPTPKIDGKSISDKYDKCFESSSHKYQIDYRILKSLAATESGSNLNTNAIGKD